MMEKAAVDQPINPYRPSAAIEMQRTRERSPQYASEAFAAGAVFAVVMLLFSPGQPHPGEYTWFERVLIVLTWNWMTAAATIVGSGAIVMGVYRVFVRRT
jgi:hypothetical protein